MGRVFDLTGSYGKLLWIMAGATLAVSSLMSLMPAYPSAPLDVLAHDQGSSGTKGEHEHPGARRGRD